MATAVVNGYTNGHTASNGIVGAGNKRYSDIPSAIDIPVSGADVDEAVELNLDELNDDPTELCALLEDENAAKNLWMTISLAYAKQHKIDLAIDICQRGLHSLSRGLPKERIGLLSLQCWLYLWKSRVAPRVVPEGQLVSEARTKDYYLQAATGALNEASRVNPSFPPLFLARGILSLLRASLQPPSKSVAPGSIEHSERIESLRQALKCFDDASRVSAGRNMMAALGKGRTLFSLGRYADALECYQDVLAKMPDLLDPDPRIGIGCCLWQLSHTEEAREAWERALELVRPSAPCSSRSFTDKYIEPQFEDRQHPCWIVSH
jgi:RNA polymerase-associated protein CTR9